MSVLTENPGQVEKKEEFEKEYVEKSNQIPFDPTFKHPLRNVWTLFYDSELSGGKRPQEWGSNIKKVLSFSSVEDFWRLYNNIAPPSFLSQGCTYNVFKEGIQPKWEDSANEKGGKWTLLLKNTEKKELDKLWQWLLLAAIGEMLEDEVQNKVCGVVVNLRKGQNKLSLWTRDADHEDSNKSIGRNIRKALELHEGVPLTYSTHNSKSTRDKYQV